MTIPLAAQTPTASFATPWLQDKPWGNELIFAGGDRGYVGKLITVGAGHALSLQYHTEKDETISIISGEATFEHGPVAGPLQNRAMHPGDTVHLPPTVVHRITALTDLVFVEASTAAPGWREDIVRLSDNYGRSGTTEA